MYRTKKKTVHKSARKFWKDDSGSSTLEFLLWVPFLVAALVFVTDTSLILQKHQDLYNQARDAARTVALGQRTADEAEADLLERLGEGASAQVEVVNNFVTASATASTAEYTALRDFIVSDTITADVSMFIENAAGS